MRKHYTRKPVADRFWPKVDRRAADGCWHWLGACGRRGYGQIRVCGEEPDTSFLAPAHRVSWEIAHGPIPDGLWVLHRCDTPSCVNPDHLFLGTPTDNTRDMLTKGRAKNATSPERRSIGERHGSAKLRDGDVIAIRRQATSGIKTRALAEAFGVSVDTVRLVVARKTWKHID